MRFLRSKINSKYRNEVQTKCHQEEVSSDPKHLSTLVLSAAWNELRYILRWQQQQQQQQQQQLEKKKEQELKKWRIKRRPSIKFMEDALGESDESSSNHPNTNNRVIQNDGDANCQRWIRLHKKLIIEACQNNAPIDIVCKLLNVIPPNTTIEKKLVELQDDYRRTLLHDIFVQNRRVPMCLIHLLVMENPLATTTCDNYGRTPLHYACMSGFLDQDILGILCEGSGLSALGMEDDNGLTPLESAIECTENNPLPKKIVDLLQEFTSVYWMMRNKDELYRLTTMHCQKRTSILDPKEEVPVLSSLLLRKRNKKGKEGIIDRSSPGRQRPHIPRRTTLSDYSEHIHNDRKHSSHGRAHSSNELNGSISRSISSSSDNNNNKYSSFSERIKNIFKSST